MILFVSLNQYFVRDEGETIHTAWRIFSGQQIYVDFFENHHPFFYYMLVPLIGIFKEGIMMVLAARVLVYLMLLSIFLVTYNIAKDLFGKEPAVISLVLLATTNIFIFTVVQLRPDVPQTLFGLLSLSLLFSYFQKKELKCLILSSISLAVSFLFLQKSIFLIFIIGVLLLLNAYSNQIKFKDVFLYLSVFIAVLVPYYAYLIFNGQLDIYLSFNWAMNVKIMQDAQYGLYVSVFKLMTSIKENPLLWIFWLLSLLFLETPNQERIGAISLFLLVTYILIHSDPHYFLLSMPLIAVMAGFAVHKVTGLFFKKRAIIIWAIVILNILYPMNTCLNVIKYSQITKQLKEMEYVLSITKSTDLIYDKEWIINTFRTNLDYFWSGKGALNWLKDKTYSLPSLDDSICKFKPKVIRKDENLYLNNETLKDYRRSDRYPDLLIRID